MSSTAARLDICNMALGFIGSRTIASLAENTPEAVQCGLFWNRARRAALQDHPWNFAVRRVVLAEKPLPGAWAGLWRHCYALPDLCLRVLSVAAPGAAGAPFCLRAGEQGGQGLFILSNEAQALAEGVFDTTDVSLWSELFVLVMARRLACLIAVPLLKNNPQKLQELEQLCRMALPRAAGQDAAEGRQGPKSDAWLQARGTW